MLDGSDSNPSSVYAMARTCQEPLNGGGGCPRDAQYTESPGSPNADPGIGPDTGPDEAVAAVEAVSTASVELTGTYDQG